MQRVKLSSRSLRRRLELGHNGLNAIRLVLAACVIVSHSVTLSGHGDDPKLGAITLGGLSVSGFFAISGYLVTNSRMHLPGWRFAARRAARIYPGYWLCLAIVAFPLAGLASLQRGGWNATDAVTFVVFNATLVFVQGTIGDTLHGAPSDTTWNGSLWTLPVEVLCYICLSLVLTSPFVRRHLKAVATTGLVVLLGLNTLAVAGRGHGSGPLYLMIFFAAGVVLYAWRTELPLTGWLGVAGLATFVLCCLSEATIALAAVPGAYFFLWLGAAMPEVLKRVGARNDISYGVYLYGWPVQQTLFAYGLGEHLVLYTVLSLLGALPFAWLSWLVIERPANLRVKRATRTTPPVGTDLVPAQA